MSRQIAKLFQIDNLFWDFLPSFLSISISRSITKVRKKSLIWFGNDDLNGVAIHTLYRHCSKITLETSSFYNQFVRPTDWLLRAQKPLIIASWLDGKKKPESWTEQVLFHVILLEQKKNFHLLWLFMLQNWERLIQQMDGSFLLAGF